MKHNAYWFAASVLVAATAAAQDDVTLATARDIASEGLRAYDAGRYEEAADKLSRAYQVVKVPTVALLTARSFVKVGKLVEASEVYLQATRLEAKGEFRAEQEKAQQDAGRERAELMPRIPKLLVTIEGADPNEVAVAIDGKDVPVALLGAGSLVDPGTRRIEGRRGQQVVTQQVTIAERERKAVTLRFGAEPAAPVASPAMQGAAPPPPAGATAPPPPAAADADTTPDGSMQRTFGWVGIGVGGAGILFGTVTGLMAVSNRSDLDANGCVDSGCYLDQKDDVDSYNALRTISTVGFVIGFVGAAAGVTLLLTAPESPSSGVETHAWLGLGSAGVAGRF